MVNALYPRTISVRRPINLGTSVGDGGFSGNDPVTSETVILSNISANISFKGENYRNPTDLPTDSRGSRWLITLPISSAALGTIQVNDIVQDEVGMRYRVAAPDWQLLGYELQTELLIV